MFSRVVRSFAVAAAVFVAAVGCAPTPEPSEPAPRFTSEAEAFAAAEETYRAYVDALNQVDLSDPETFEAVYTWTTGDTNAEARQSLSRMHADGWSVSGMSSAAIVQPVGSFSSSLSEVELAICLDVSDVVLTDRAGELMVDADRPDIQKMLATLVLADSSRTGWLVTSLTGREGSPECG